ncbi:MAG: extracellular solute-binding protein [Treponema sp.]|nr:extracellular solute-binding protein [Treponema sp.]
MKKNFFTSCLILFSIIFVSCFEKNAQKHYTSATPKATLNLALRSGIYSEVIKKCLKDFEKTYDIFCNVYEFSEADLHSSILDGASYPEGPYDFCMVDGSWMAEFTSKNILANLSELGYSLDDDIIPATKTICFYNDNVYLAPYYGNVTVLLYNRIMVHEAGYKPEEINSLEDIFKICEFQKNRHNLGFVFRGDTMNNIVVDFLPILRSRGAWVVDENNRPTVNTSEFSEALYFYLDLIETGRAASKNDLIAAIANKSAAMGIGWPGWYTPTKNSSMDYIALSGKFRNDRPSYNSNIYGIWAVGIPENSINKEYAEKLLEYLMDKEVQKTTVSFGGVPCRYSSLNDTEILQKFPQYNAVREALEGGIYRPVIENWTEFYTILGQEMKAIIDGKKEVFEGLYDAQRELEKSAIKTDYSKLAIIPSKYFLLSRYAPANAVSVYKATVLESISRSNLKS